MSREHPRHAFMPGSRWGPWSAYLDEVERLRRELSLHATADGPGPIPAESLRRWRTEAEAAESTLADRLLAVIDEIEARRRGAAAGLGSGSE